VQIQLTVQLIGETTIKLTFEMFYQGSGLCVQLTVTGRPVRVCGGGGVCVCVSVCVC